MEAPGLVWDEKSQLKVVLLYEFLGTAVVTYAYTLSNFATYIRALAYFIAFVVCAHISGAHLNPATTLACHISDRLIGRHATPEKQS